MVKPCYGDFKFKKTWGDLQVNDFQRVPFDLHFNEISYYTLENVTCKNNVKIYKCLVQQLRYCPGSLVHSAEPFPWIQNNYCEMEII